MKKKEKINNPKLGIIILSLLSIIPLACAFPPLNLYPLAFIAFVPLMLLIYKTDKAKELILASVTFVLGFFGYLLTWIAAFMLRGTSAIVAVLTLMLILSLLIFIFYFPAMLLSAFISKRMPAIRWLAIAAIFAAMEYLRTVGYLGFPWGIVGYSQWNFLPLIQVADITGVLGISFLVYLTNGIIAHIILTLIERKSQKNSVAQNIFAPVVTLVSIFVVVIFYGVVKINIEDTKRSYARKIPVALVQTAFDPNHNWRHIYTGEPAISGNGGIQGLAERFLLKPQKFQSKELPDGETQNGTIAVVRAATLAMEVALSRPSLTVYPESATQDSYNYYAERYANDFLSDNLPTGVQPGIYNTYLLYKMIQATDGYHLLGTTLVSETTNESGNINYNYHNGILFLDPNAEIIDSYAKIKLVPGPEAYPFQDSEYFLTTPPFKEILGFVYEQLDKARGGRWTRGKRQNVFLHPHGYVFAGLICYESAFGDFTRKFTRNGAEFLNILTDDAWSYSDNSQWQHFYMAIFRAIESRRDTLQNGNSGVTGHISSSGRIISTLPFWQPGYMTANVALNTKQTFYSLYGEWFTLLYFIFPFFLLMFCLIKSIRLKIGKVTKRQATLKWDRNALLKASKKANRKAASSKPNSNQLEANQPHALVSAIELDIKKSNEHSNEETSLNQPKAEESNLMTSTENTVKKILDVKRDTELNKQPKNEKGTQIKDIFANNFGNSLFESDGIYDIIDADVPYAGREDLNEIENIFNDNMHEDKISYLPGLSDIMEESRFDVPK